MTHWAHPNLRTYRCVWCVQYPLIPVDTGLQMSQYLYTLQFMKDSVILISWLVTPFGVWSKNTQEHRKTICQEDIRLALYMPSKMMGMWWIIKLITSMPPKGTVVSSLCLALYFTFDAANLSTPWVIVDINILKCGGDNGLPLHLFATKAMNHAVQRVTAWLHLKTFRSSKAF